MLPVYFFNGGSVGIIYEKFAISVYRAWKRIPTPVCCQWNSLPKSAKPQSRLTLWPMSASSLWTVVTAVKQELIRIYLFIFIYKTLPHSLYVQQWKFALVIRKCIQCNAEGYKGLALTYALLINEQHVKHLKLASSLTKTVRQWKISHAHIHIIENINLYIQKKGCMIVSKISQS